MPPARISEVERPQNLVQTAQSPVLIQHITLVSWVPPSLGPETWRFTGLQTPHALGVRLERFFTAKPI